MPDDGPLHRAKFMGPLPCGADPRYSWSTISPRSWHETPVEERCQECHAWWTEKLRGA